MNEISKLEIKRSELKSELNTLTFDKTDHTDDELKQIEEKRKALEAVEVRYRAAVALAGDEAEKIERATDGEGAELRALKGKASMARYVRGAAEGVVLQGAEAELNEALKLGESRDGIRVPFSFLADAMPAVEKRVDAATDSAALGGGTMQRPIMPRLWGRGASEALGVDFYSVPSGLTRFPLISGGATAEQKSESARKDAQAATFATASLEPRRLTARYLTTIEQAAEVPDLESALKMDLVSALKSAMDDQIINGNGTSPNVDGFLSRIADPTNDAQVADFDRFTELLSLAVDGVHANSEREVSLVLGVASYQLAAKVNHTGSGESATEAIMRRGRSLMASSYIPAVASNIQTCLLHAGGAGRAGDSVAAVWPSMELIRDPYSNAAEGQCALTAVALWNCVTAFRAGAYARVDLKVS